MLRIVVDAMGADNGVEPIVSGVKLALKYKDFKAIIVGNQNLISRYLSSSVMNNVEIIHCDNYIKMEDMATNALKKKDSSIYRAVEIVKEGMGDAVISAAL